MLTGTGLAGLLEAEGYDFAAGVPCSMVEDLIIALDGHPPLPYVPAVREDAAVALAAGAWLAGRRPVVIMQNSGLGTSLNAVVSLSLMYRLPALLLVTWRGFGGKDAPEHLVMGEISPRLLELLAIPHRVLSADGAPDDLAWARRESARLSQPVALLLPPGVLETGHAHASASPVAAGSASPDQRPGFGNRVAASPAAKGQPAISSISGGPDMAPARPQRVETQADNPLPLVPRISRLEALRAALAPVRGEPIVHANGYICRESFSVKDREASFYMIGSMGCAAAIGLGVALARPATPAIVFDGDGNLLMSLGVLPMIGGAPAPGGGRADKLVHVVFDNEVYGSTGNQRSPGAHVRLDHLAAAAGYPRACAVTTAADVQAAVTAALGASGPSFILVKVTTEEQPVPRIPYSPQELRDRFRRALGGAA